MVGVAFIGGHDRSSAHVAEEEDAARAGTLADEALHPVLNPAGFANAPFYPLSFEKVRRMLSRLVVNGFASFAEA